MINSPESQKPRSYTRRALAYVPMAIMMGSWAYNMNEVAESDAKINRIEEVIETVQEQGNDDAVTQVIALREQADRIDASTLDNGIYTLFSILGSLGGAVVAAAYSGKE